MRITAGAAALCAALLLSACGNEAPVRMAGLTTFKHSEPVVARWAVTVGKGTDGNYLRLDPAVNGRSVYASDYCGRVLSIDRCSGRVNWFSPVSTHVTSGVGYGDGKVVVGGDNGMVYGMRSSDGQILWRAQVPGEVLATPTVTRQQVFVKTANGRIIALDSRSGRQQWQYRSENPSLILRSDSRVAVYRNMAIAGFSDGSVVAFDQKDGHVVWGKQFAMGHGASVVDRMVDITANLALENGTLYVASYNGYVAALKAATGKTVWEKALSVHAGLTLGPSAVYVSDAKSHVWAFAKRNGQVLWHNDLLEGREISGPAYLRGAIIVGDKKGYVHWLAKEDGHFIARERVDSSWIYTSPVTKDNSIYVYSGQGELVDYQMG